MEQAKANDVTSSGLIARPASSEAARAMGKFTFECYDNEGKLKWTAESKNLVVNVGLQYMAGTALDGATARITAWYIGLTGAGASNQFNATDTMSSHPAAGSGGWTEITPYSNANRPAATFAAATTANPSVVTNSASKASYTINSSATIGGAFLTSDNTKGGTTGTLFSGSDFTGGDRSVVNGDTLQVTYTFSLAA